MPAPDVDPAIRPNFFIVGAAKAGTSTLHTWLGTHPQIFMTARKETSFFCADLDLPGQPVRSLVEYMQLFEPGRGALVRGESSVSYLLSPSAPSVIAEFAPDARILVSIRNPVDALVSHYGEGRLWGTERSVDINRALAPLVRGNRGTFRRQRAQIPYERLVSLAGHIERYTRTFPPERMRIVVYEEWTRRPATVLADVLDFLDVDPVEITSLPRVRGSHRIRSARLQRWLVTAPPSAALVTRGRLGRQVMPFLRRVNISQQPIGSLDPALREELARWLEPEVARLSEVVGRDLSKVWEQASPPTDTTVASDLQHE